MEAQEVAIAGQTTFNIIMREETIGLEEVVAIGYGTVKKKDLTGAVTQVNAEKLDNPHFWETFRCIVFADNTES